MVISPVKHWRFYQKSTSSTREKIGICQGVNNQPSLYLLQWIGLSRNIHKAVGFYRWISLDLEVFSRFFHHLVLRFEDADAVGKMHLYKMYLHTISIK